MHCHSFDNILFLLFLTLSLNIKHRIPLILRNKIRGYFQLLRFVNWALIMELYLLFQFFLPVTSCLLLLVKVIVYLLWLVLSFDILLESSLEVFHKLAHYLRMHSIFQLTILPLPFLIHNFSTDKLLLLTPFRLSLGRWECSWLLRVFFRLFRGRGAFFTWFKLREQFL
jgi:hypothetical protein